MFSNTEITAEMGSLRRFALKLTRNPHTADDLLQATLLRALEKKELYQDGTNLFSWTSKIMFNIFVTNYRRKTRFETLQDPDIFLDKESTEPTQDYAVELRNVQEAMNHISPEHKEILIMVCVLGMQYTEVADKLHIPIGTVRSRLARARESLQNTLHTKSPRTALRLPQIASNDLKYEIAA